MGILLQELAKGTSQPKRKRGVGKQAPSIETLHRLECRACPLNNANVTHPKMEPSGSDEPLIYILAEAPGETEDLEGEPLVGKAGQLLRKNIPGNWLDVIRMNNCIRTRPPGNRTPDQVEIECCRPSIIRDIEKTKPKAIWGMGGVPLAWMMNATGIRDLWRGKRCVVKVGKHRCWFYPMLHPSFIARGVGGFDNDWSGGEERDKIPGDEYENIFRRDIKRALREVRKLKPPPKITVKGLKKDIACVWGEEPELDLKVIYNYFQYFIASSTYVGFDYETVGLQPYASGAKILSFSLSDWHRTIAIAVDHPQALWTKIQRDWILRRLQELMEHKSIELVSHNTQFEMKWTAKFLGSRYVRTFGKQWHDTQAQAYVLDERHKKPKRKGERGIQALDTLCNIHLGLNLKSLSNTDVTNLINEPIKEVLHYNGLDSKATQRLFCIQKKLIKREKLEDVYIDQIRCLPTLALASHVGVPVHAPTVKKLTKEAETKRDYFVKQIRKLREVKKFEDHFGHEFSPSSDKDVAALLKDIMKRPEGQRGKKYSSDREVLLSIEHPFSELEIEFRRWDRLLTTNLRPLEKGKDSYVFPDNKFHTQYNTTFTRTRRLSSENPNAQNFPKRKDPWLRKVVRAMEGYYIVALDYGQIEARVIAMASKDKNLCQALWENYDIHMEWAERIAYTYPPRIGGKKMLKDKKAMKDFRTDIKNQWTFPLFFGAQLGSTAGYLHIPEDVISPLYDEFWDQFQGVLQWQEDTHNQYKELGYVETLNGFKQRAPLSWNQLINGPIQGTASEITVNTMNKLSEAAQEIGDPDLQPIMNIHDDITSIYPEKNIEDYMEVVISAALFPDYDFINVPISVEVEVGPNWFELEPVGTFFSNEWE